MDTSVSTTLPLHSRLEQAVRRIGALSDVAGLSGAVLAEFRHVMEPDVACWYVPNASGGSVTAAAVHPTEFWARPEISTEFTNRDIDRWGIGQAVRERRVVLFEDALAAAEAGSLALFSAAVTSEIVAPIFYEESLAGIVVVAVLNGRRYSDDDRAAAGVLASSVEAMYRSFEQQGLDDTQVQALREVGEIMSSDLDLAVGRFLEQVSLLVPASFISFWIHNRLDNTLVLKHYHPMKLGPRRITFDSIGAHVLRLEECLSGVTIKAKYAQFFEDIATNPRNANGKFTQEFGLTWLVSLPVMSEGEPVAVVNVYPTEARNRIPQRAVDFTAALVAGFGRLLSEGQLKAQQRLRRSYVQTCRRLAASPKFRYWDAVAQHIASDLDCEACSIFRLLPATTHLELSGTTGLEKTYSYKDVRYEIGEGLTGTCVYRNAPVIYYQEMSEEVEGIHKSKYRERLKTPGRTKSLLLVPIKDESGAPIGVIRCNGKATAKGRHNGRFTQQDVALVNEIADVIVALAPVDMTTEAQP